jgi:hypothetical protein
VQPEGAVESEIVRSVPGGPPKLIQETGQRSGTPPPAESMLAAVFAGINHDYWSPSRSLW